MTGLSSYTLPGVVLESKHSCCPPHHTVSVLCAVLGVSSAESRGRVRGVTLHVRGSLCSGWGVCGLTLVARGYGSAAEVGHSPPGPTPDCSRVLGEPRR